MAFLSSTMLIVCVFFVLSVMGKAFGCRSIIKLMKLTPSGSNAWKLPGQRRSMRYLPRLRGRSSALIVGCKTGLSAPAPERRSLQLKMPEKFCDMKRNDTTNIKFIPQQEKFLWLGLRGPGNPARPFFDPLSFPSHTPVWPTCSACERFVKRMGTARYRYGIKLFRSQKLIRTKKLIFT